MPIDVSCVETDKAVRCSIAGEIDLTAEPRVRHALFQALAARPQTLVIDLGAVTFIDSTGLRVLISARNRAEQTATQVVLAHVGPNVARILAIANLTNFFEFDASVER